jgi:predicted PurR-regulated permease PerM
MQATLQYERNPL